MDTIHTFKLSIDWMLISILSKIDRYDAEGTVYKHPLHFISPNLS